MTNNVVKSSPGDPVRGALEALVKSVQYIAEDYVPDHPCDNGAALEEMREALFALVRANGSSSALSSAGNGASSTATTRTIARSTTASAPNARMTPSPLRLPSIARRTNEPQTSIAFRDASHETNSNF